MKPSRTQYYFHLLKQYTSVKIYFKHMKYDFCKSTLTLKF